MSKVDQLMVAHSRLLHQTTFDLFNRIKPEHRLCTLLLGKALLGNDMVCNAPQTSRWFNN
jgi:hypothetical protein